MIFRMLLIRVLRLGTQLVWVLATLHPLQGEIVELTVPSAYLEVTISGGSVEQPAVSAIGVPVMSSERLRAEVSAAVSDGVTLSGITLVAGEFTGSGNAHVLEFLSGQGEGRIFPVTSNSTSAFVLQTAGTDLQAIVVQGDQFRVARATTLANLFSGVLDDIMVGPAVNQVDNVLIWQGDHWQKFFNDGVHWQRFGNHDEFDDWVLPPEDGLIYLRRGGADLSLIIEGRVPDHVRRSVIREDGLTLLNNQIPLATTLGELNLTATGGWLTGQEGSADLVFLWGGTSWVTFWHDGSSWRGSGMGGNRDNEPIPLGSTLFVRRRGGQAAIYTQNLPYTLE